MVHGISTYLEVAAGKCEPEKNLLSRNANHPCVSPRCFRKGPVEGASGAGRSASPQIAACFAGAFLLGVQGTVVARHAAEAAWGKPLWRLEPAPHRCTAKKKKSASQEALWVRGVDGVYMLLGSAVTICGKNHRITRASTIRKK